MSYNLINGDCLTEMMKLEPHSVDMILCDLPYGITDCSWDEIIPFDKLWECYNRVIKKDGAIVLFGSEPFTSKIVCSNLRAFRHDWIWKKPQGSNFALVHY